jgi:GTP-binding protein HflX
MPNKDVGDEFEALMRESARIAAEYDSSESDELVDPTLELSERHALRRVRGFSTELQDISEAEYRQLQLERVVLVGVWTEGTSTMAENSLAELKALAETAGSEVLEGRAKTSRYCNRCRHGNLRWRTFTITAAPVRRES